MVMILRRSLINQGADSGAHRTFIPELKMTDGETWIENALFRLTSQAPASGNVCLKSVRMAPCGTRRQ